MKTKLCTLLILFSLVVSFVGCGDNYDKIEPPDKSYFVGNVFQIVAKNMGEVPVATGSGFVFNRDGWFITNYHVMEDAYFATAIFNIPDSELGESFTHLQIEKVYYCHADKDIFIGRISNYDRIVDHYKDIPICSEYEIGDVAFSVGYPSSSVDIEVNKGQITDEWSDLYNKLYSGNNYIYSTSFIAPGSSGGILVNASNEVIGITTLGEYDSNDNFMAGASISAFNFKNQIESIDEKRLVSLEEMLHPDEKKFIGYYKEAVYDKDANEIVLDDGTVAYAYEWNEEGVNDSGSAFVLSENFIIASDKTMYYDEEYYWESGDRRYIAFYGQYSDTHGFDNFEFEFTYEWKNGDCYTLYSNDINYSTNLALTLNKYDLEYDPTKIGVTDENIEYAKKIFNATYEWLVEDMSRFD